MNNSFMNLISETDCRFKKYIDRYHGQPLILLGAGVGARSIVKYLEEHDIKDFHICVDEGYWKKDQYLESCPIENILTVFKENPNTKFDIIVGFYNAAAVSMEYLRDKYPDRISDIIYEDIIPHFWMKPQIFTVDREYYDSHDKELTDIYNALCDEQSRKVMRSFIEQRISGDYAYSGGVLSLKENEYFEPELLSFEKDITLIDCGAYDGDDTERFFGKFDKNRCFSFVIEPDCDNLDFIRHRLKEYSNSIEIINKALWDIETELSFRNGGGEGSGIVENGEDKIHTISIDELYRTCPKMLSDNKVLIKMDIEGAEMKALQGGEKFISEKHPILAVCVYHKPDDIFELPKKILELDNNYRLYMRRYCTGFRDTVLYAL